MRIRYLTLAFLPLAIALLARAERAGPPVTYLESPRVAAAFEKGAPLLENGAYKIHASRREGPGLAEVHELDTDIIYVLEGTATFVTGGRMVEPSTVSPHEVRGEEIQDGTTRQLVKGDVIVVPSGTPHWFRKVEKPFLYYVVKVTDAGAVQ